MIVLIHNYKILTSELRFFPFPIILSFISLFSFLISFHVFFSIPLIVSIPLDFVTISSIHFSSIYSLFAPLSYTLPSLIVLSISLCNSQSLYLSFSLSLSLSLPSFLYPSLFLSLPPLIYFSPPKGAVECWLSAFETAMRDTLYDMSKAAYHLYPAGPEGAIDRTEWLGSFPAQV